MTARRLGLLMVLSAAAGCADSSAEVIDGGGDGGDGPAGDVGWGRPASCVPRPVVPNLGGPVLTDWDMVVISAANDPTDDAVSLMNALASSQWLKDQTSAYGVAPPSTTLDWTGPAIAAAPANPTPADGLSDDQVTTYISTLIQAHPASDRVRLYALLLPPSARFTHRGALNDADCSDVGGYHYFFTDASAFRQPFLVVAACQASAPLEDPARVRGANASHEVIEAVTDPFGDAFRLTGPSAWARMVGSGWLENADLCEGTRVDEGQQIFQRNWSNPAAAGSGDPCTPAADSGYFSVCPLTDWTPISPGAHGSITLQAWSTEAVVAWRVGAKTAWVTDRQPTFQWHLQAGRTSTIAGSTLPLVDAGETLTVEIDMGADAPSGFAVVLSLRSSRRNADGSSPATGDVSHEEVVGFLVP